LEPEVVDLYSGFEGEPEFTVSLSRAPDGPSVAIVKAWSGFVDELMTHVQPSGAGWRGFALEYHVHTRWDQPAGWIDPEPRDTAEILVHAAQSSASVRARQFANAVQHLSALAKRDGGIIAWKRD
jgi:hypothetical protein